MALVASGSRGRQGDSKPRQRDSVTRGPSSDEEDARAEVDELESEDESGRAPTPAQKKLKGEDKAALRSTVSNKLLSANQAGHTGDGEEQAHWAPAPTKRARSPTPEAEPEPRFNIGQIVLAKINGDEWPAVVSVHHGLRIDR